MYRPHGGSVAHGALTPADGREPSVRDSHRQSRVIAFPLVRPPATADQLPPFADRALVDQLGEILADVNGALFFTDVRLDGELTELEMRGGVIRSLVSAAGKLATLAAVAQVADARTWRGVRVQITPAGRAAVAE